MLNELLPQDIEVLKRTIKEYGYTEWAGILERAVVLARQTETQRCLKEIDEMIKYIDNELVIAKRIYRLDNNEIIRQDVGNLLEWKTYTENVLKKRLQRDEEK